MEGGDGQALPRRRLAEWPGSSYSTRGNHLDLDPTYTDPHGRPLMRMTFDYSKNDLQMARFLSDRMVDIVKVMNPAQMTVNGRAEHYDIVPYQSTHTCGGAIMGADPKTQRAEQIPPVLGRSQRVRHGRERLPAERGDTTPREPWAPLAYSSAKAIREHYLKSPGPLVQA